MSVYSRLSVADILELRADLAMGKKLLEGYLNLVVYLQRFGSVPAGDRALSSVLGFTVRYLRDVAWPLLQDRLVMSDDGQRYYDPDISAVRPQRRAPGAPVVQQKSPQHQAAALTRHARARTEAEAHAKAHAERMETHADDHTNTMRGASETHAQNDADACADAFGASSPAHTNSLSLREGSVEQPIEKESVLERESSHTGARDDASDDASSHARTHKNHAETHASAHAQGIRPILPSVRPIRADWKPSAETRATAETIRKDVDVQIQNFIRFNTGRGNTAADWDALFPRFLEHANEYDERRGPQSSLPIVISGGKREPEFQATSEPPDEPIIGTSLEAQWARVQRSLGKGISRNWLSKSEIIGLDDEGELTIAFPTQFIRDHVAKNHGTRLTALWQVENQEFRRLNFDVETQQRRSAPG
jgi:hypothetical protein